MSRGIGGKAELIAHDDTDVVYVYSVYNLNEAAHRDAISILDGEIHLKRDCFTEPEIHNKRVRKPSGRKVMVEKRIVKIPDYGAMIADGSITIKNASHCFKTTSEGMDIMALNLLYKMFQQYQEDGELPTQISYHV